MSKVTDQNSDSMLSGFPKFSALPKIPDVPSTDLIPYQRDNERYNRSTGDVMDRVNDLESRLSITEKSNRALLEEVVRLHGEFRSTTKYYEDAFKEERKVRAFIENSWQAVQDHVRGLESRLRTAEDGLGQERHQLRDLALQAKTVEEQLFSAKKDNSVLGERHLFKLVQLEREVEGLYSDRQKMEKISFQLVEEMGMIKSKLESQGYDFSAITSELRNKSKRLEDEYITKMESVKKQLSRPQDGNSPTDASYRGMLEHRLSEMRDHISQIRSWHDDEIIERRNLEQSVLSKISEMTHAMNDQARNREEALRQLQYLIREKEHKSETDKLSMQNKLVEMTENINSKVLEKDLRLREEQLKRQSELEKLLRSEQETRISYEREIRLENERRMETIRQFQTEELNNIKDSMKHDKAKYVESVKRLDEAVSLIERQIDQNRNEITKIVTAEVKARAANDQTHSGRIVDLEDKISAATSSLQQALAGLANQSVPNSERLKKVIDEVFSEYRGDISHQIADLDARILNLQSHSARDVCDFDEKIKEDSIQTSAISRVNRSLQDRVESISLWQSTVNAGLGELKIQKQQLKQEIYELNESFVLARAELKTRADLERDTRIEEIARLREELVKLNELLPMDIITKSDIEKMKSTSRKLAESMQTIKTVLGMKIQSEQKLRLEEIRGLQDDLLQLHNLVEPLIERKLPPRLFIKPPLHDKESDITGGLSRAEQEMTAPAINQWSLFNANRWLHWKTKWMYVKWLVSNRKNPEKPPPEASSTAENKPPSTPANEAVPASSSPLPESSPPADAPPPPPQNNNDQPSA